MISQLLQNIGSVDKAKVAKVGGVAIVISLGLQAAVLAGVAIPVWGQFAGLAVGLVLHAILPVKVQSEVDGVVDQVIDVATEIPTLSSAPTDFPNAPPQEHAQGQTNSNINQ